MTFCIKVTRLRTTFRTHATVKFRPTIYIGRRSAMSRNPLEEENGYYLLGYTYKSLGP
jgi:hypothetical protein